MYLFIIVIIIIIIYAIKCKEQIKGMARRLKVEITKGLIDKN